MILWSFSKEEYHSIKSTKVIEADRIKKLDKIRDKDLQCLADHIKTEKYAAYQELLISKYIEDIKGML